MLAKLERQEREGALIPRDDSREGLGRIAARLRAAGELLERQFGAEAGRTVAVRKIDPAAGPLS